MVVYTLISPSQSRICVYICYILNNVKKKESASANSVIAGNLIVSNHNCYHSHWPTTCSCIHIRGQTDLEQARTAQLFTPRAWDKCIRSATTPEQLGGPEQEWLSELYARFAFHLDENIVGTLKKSDCHCEHTASAGAFSVAPKGSWFAFCYRLVEALKQSASCFRVGYGVSFQQFANCKETEQCLWGALEAPRSSHISVERKDWNQELPLDCKLLSHN